MILTIACILAVILAAILLLLFSMCGFAPGFSLTERGWFLIGAAVCLGIVVGGFAGIAKLGRDRDQP